MNKLSANLSENALALPSCSNDNFVGYTKVGHISLTILRLCLTVF